MNISKFQSNLDFIKNIYFYEEWKDEKCRDTILEALEEANDKIEKAFGKSMHRLGTHKPSTEAVEKVVTKFPSTISHGDEDFGSRLPIHTAVNTDTNGTAYEYVPVLAKEGIKYQVGGEDTRGGIFMVDPYFDYNNPIQELCYFDRRYESEEIRKSRLAALKDLRKLGLLLKKDIQEYDLLSLSFCGKKYDIFDYLVDWDPDALIVSKNQVVSLIHFVSSHLGKEEQSKLLLAGFKYHPHIGGLLFLKNSDGITALDHCCRDNISTNRFMNALDIILSQKKDYPILHHVFTKAPKHKELFAKTFPWAGSLKDHNGRSLHQALLAAGPEVMNQNEVLFATLTDNQIRKKDPMTTLFPFAAMAVGEHADLEKCFYLLRRSPSVLDRRSRANSKVRRRRKKQKVHEIASNAFLH